MELSPLAYEEIKAKLISAGYEDSLHHQDDYGLVLDMHGIAVAKKPDKIDIKCEHEESPTSGAINCMKCGAIWAGEDGWITSNQIHKVCQYCQKAPIPEDCNCCALCADTMEME